ncbi:MAG: ComEC/Rec2 family competence protein [Candidatus Ventricola sp.]
MKRILALCLTLLLAACAACAEEQIIIDKTRGENADFAFAEDAGLLEVYFPKIYGCDAALVRCGEYTMLIDCGGTQWREVRSLLESLNVTELTYALNSHPDRDHIGGFDHVLKAIPAGEFLLGFPEDYPDGDGVRFEVYDALHEMGVPMRRVHSGDTIEFGDARVTVYQRTDEELPRVNNKSVLLMIEYGERRIFFAGDIQAATQTLLAEDDALDLKADILKYPHHGYKALQESFIDKLSPGLVICTCGQIDTDGLIQMKKLGIPSLLAVHGRLRLATDGSVWTVERIQ